MSIHADEYQEVLPVGGQTTPRGKALLEDVSLYMSESLIGTTAIKPCNVTVWGTGLSPDPS